MITQFEIILSENNYQKMSIARGINNKNHIRCPSTVQTHSTQPNLSNNFHQQTQQTQQIKTIIQENTKIKQENLELKQQIMLLKIQLEATKIKNQEIVNDMQQQIKSAFQIINKFISQQQKDFENSQKSKDFKIFDRKISVVTRQDHMNIPLYINSHRQLNSWNSKASSRSSSNNNMLKSEMLKKKSFQMCSKRSSRKEQILNKYRKLQLNFQSSSQRLSSSSQTFQH